MLCESGRHCRRCSLSSFRLFHHRDINKWPETGITLGQFSVWHFFPSWAILSCWLIEAVMLLKTRCYHEAKERDGVRKSPSWCYSFTAGRIFLCRWNINRSKLIISSSFSSFSMFKNDNERKTKFQLGYRYFLVCLQIDGHELPHLNVILRKSNNNGFAIRHHNFFPIAKL